MGLILVRIYDSYDTAAKRAETAAQVLKDTEMTDSFTGNEATAIRVNYGNILGNGDNNDALVTVSFGPENNIMAVYRKNGDSYEYAGTVGYFYGVDNISIEKLADRPDVIIFRERNNQSIGAREKSGFIRGYMYQNGKFENVLNIDENIESWFSSTDNGKTSWEKVEQTSVINPSENNQTIDTTKKQTYSTAEGNNDRTVPPNNDFKILSERKVNEQYNWSNYWNTYILEEKTENSTGKKVAVLTDFSNSTNALTGGDFNKYKILRDDGSAAIINHSETSEV